jgi:hypothetical protein
MNRKSFYLLLIALGLSIFSSGLGAHSSPAATIDKVITQTGKVNTRIILETDSAPALVRTYYADKTIVVELGQVNLTTPLPVEEAAGPLVKGIQLEKTGPEQARLQVQIQELIPYTVVSSAKRTVIELNRIQRGPGEIPMEQRVQQWLTESSGSNAFMTKLKMEENDSRLRFWAKLSSKTVAQVFTLENPLRLVIDVYDAVYEGALSVLPVDRFGLKNARVAQFQFNSPRCITRIVFDLKAPKYYDLRVDNREIAVSFFKQ